MIVLVTNRDDLTADWLILELESRGADFWRLNTEDYPARMRIEITDERTEIRSADRRVRASDVSAVWWRRPVAPEWHDSRSPAEADWAAAEAAAALNAFWAVADPHWLNHPLANAAADCKPEQLRRAARLGLTVPDTLVTNDAGAAVAFFQSHHRVICKAVYDGSVPLPGGNEGLLYTSLIEAPAVLDALDAEPYTFQAEVAKRYDVRVTVIGDEAFACRINSQDVPEGSRDWRMADVDRLPHSIEPLPTRLADRCIELTHSYGLRFSAIDLARTPEGGYCFFELNPNGQWAWVEQLTALPLRSRLTDELLRAKG